MRPATLEIVPLRPSLRQALVELFLSIERDGDARRFHTSEGGQFFGTLDLASYRERPP